MTDSEEQSRCGGGGGGEGSQSLSQLAGLFWSCQIVVNLRGGRAGGWRDATRWRYWSGRPGPGCEASRAVPWLWMTSPAPLRCQGHAGDPRSAAAAAAAAAAAGPAPRASFAGVCHRCCWVPPCRADPRGACLVSIRAGAFNSYYTFITRLFVNQLQIIKLIVKIELCLSRKNGFNFIFPIQY